MSSNTSRPQAEKTTIAGPAGALEAIVEAPGNADGARVAPAVIVICHPHPSYGGTMTNKVVHTLARACNDFGVPAVRFNFRGVGASAGSYDAGAGETQDAVAVLDWAAKRWPGARLWAGGFSFGGAIAIRAAAARDVRRLVTVAPAIDRVAVDDARLPRCPWLIVQGDSDELVSAENVRRWAQALPSPPQLSILRGVDHFFHGRLNELRALVLEWLERQRGAGE